METKEEQKSIVDDSKEYDLDYDFDIEEEDDIDFIIKNKQQLNTKNIDDKSNTGNNENINNEDENAYENLIKEIDKELSDKFGEDIIEASNAFFDDIKGTIAPLQMTHNEALRSVIPFLPHSDRIQISKTNIVSPLLIGNINAWDVINRNMGEPKILTYKTFSRETQETSTSLQTEENVSSEQSNSSQLNSNNMFYTTGYMVPPYVVYPPQNSNFSVFSNINTPNMTGYGVVMPNNVVVPNMMVYNNTINNIKRDNTPTVEQKSSIKKNNNKKENIETISIQDRNKPINNGEISVAPMLKLPYYDNIYVINVNNTHYKLAYLKQNSFDRDVYEYEDFEINGNINDRNCDCGLNALEQAMLMSYIKTKDQKELLVTPKDERDYIRYFKSVNNFVRTFNINSFKTTSEKYNEQQRVLLYKLSRLTSIKRAIESNPNNRQAPIQLEVVNNLINGCKDKFLNLFSNRIREFDEIIKTDLYKKNFAEIYKGTTRLIPTMLDNTLTGKDKINRIFNNFNDYVGIVTRKDLDSTPNKKELLEAKDESLKYFTDRYLKLTQEEKQSLEQQINEKYPEDIEINRVKKQEFILLTSKINKEQLSFNTALDAFNKYADTYLEENIDNSNIDNMVEKRDNYLTDFKRQYAGLTNECRERLKQYLNCKYETGYKLLSEKQQDHNIHMQNILEVATKDIDNKPNLGGLTNYNINASDQQDINNTINKPIRKVDIAGLQEGLVKHGKSYVKQK